VSTHKSYGTIRAVVRENYDWGNIDETILTEVQSCTVYRRRFILPLDIDSVYDESKQTTTTITKTKNSIQNNSGSSK